MAVNSVFLFCSAFDLFDVRGLFVFKRSEVFFFGGFVRTIGSVREFCSAVLFLFGRSLENVFVL